MTKENASKKEIKEKIKELVIARIEAEMPSHLKISIGGGKSLTKEEMIEHVKIGDETGKQIVDIHLNFIKAVVSGQLIKEITSI